MVNKTKIGIYGANIALKPFADLVIKPVAKGIENLTKMNFPQAFKGLNFGNGLNLYGGIYFAALDFLGACSDKIKDSKFTNLSKIAGVGVYGLSTLGGLVETFTGDFSAFPKTILDGLMTYQLGKDSVEHYNQSGNDLLDDANPKNWF